MTPAERQAIAEAVRAVVRQDARQKVAATRDATASLKTTAEQHEALWRELDAQLDELEGVLGEPPAAPERPRQRAKVSAAVKGALEAAGLPRSMGVATNLDGQAVVAMDEASLALAVRSLLDNAREAAGPTGHVAVVVKASAERVTVRVVDDGPGLPTERLAHPARPLERPRPGHAGLGLCVAWRVARRAGGELSVRNAERGGGAIVELDLPAAPKEAT